MSFTPICHPNDDIGTKSTVSKTFGLENKLAWSEHWKLATYKEVVAK